MIPPEQINFLRSIKGTAAHVLLILILTGCSHNNRELQLLTGRSDKTITDALRLLESLHLAQNNGRQHGWSFPQNTQLPLFPASIVNLRDRKISDLAPYTTTTTKDPRSSKVVEEAEPRSENLRSSLQSAGIGRDSPAMHQLLAAKLDQDQVNAWLNYFHWWHKQRKQHPNQLVDGRQNFTAGLLIKILLDGDAAPAARCHECLELPSDCYCDLIAK